MAVSPVPIRRIDPVIERIEMELSKQGISQLALCEHLGLKRQSFTKWKNGQSRSYYQRIAEIAEYLNVSISYLLDVDYERVREERMTPTEREIIRRYRKMEDPLKDWFLTAIRLACGERKAGKRKTANGTKGE